MVREMFGTFGTSAGVRLELHLILEKWLQTAKVSDLTGKKLKLKQSEQVLKPKVKGKQETEPIQRHLGPGHTEGVGVQEAKERLTCHVLKITTS